MYRFRVRLRRSAITYWFTALALAGVTGIFVTGLVRGAETRAARYGAARQVPVATRPLAAGAVVRAGDVTAREMPSAFLPDSALVTTPVGRTVVVPMLAGEAFLAAKLAPGGVEGVAALLEPGERALAVPRGPGIPPLRVGHHVDVIATTPDGATEVVALEARVVGLDDEAVTVAVDEYDAPGVAAALAAATVTLALTAP